MKDSSTEEQTWTFGSKTKPYLWLALKKKLWQHQLTKVRAATQNELLGMEILTIYGLTVWLFTG